MIIVKTEREIGTYLHESSVDGKPLRQIKSMDDLYGIPTNEYEIIKTDNTIPIYDLDRAKQESMTRYQ